MSKASELTFQHSLRSGLEIHAFRHFRLQTLVIESQALKNNPLGDSHVRANPILVPVSEPPREGWPVVFVLAGFTGNGPNYLNLKTFEENMPQVLDKCRERGEAPDALYVLCEAMTVWGGSQFLNSEGTGRYEDYIAQEVTEAVRKSFHVEADASRWCVAGGSSGGYGALHLASRHAETFGLAAAVAPDSFFEASLLPEIWTAIPSIEKLGGVAGVRSELESGRLMKRRESHAMLNAIAMGLCYAPDGRNDVDFPVDSKTGVVKPERWQRWKAHDPIEFLKMRHDEIKKLSRVFLDVGTRDQYHLQYGTRQIRAVLEAAGTAVDYSEFEGNHFDIGERRPEIWKWLRAQWSQEPNA
jgi:enterochelin esterase-like enzyme